MNVVVSAIVDPWVTTFSFVVALAMRIQDTINGSKVPSDTTKIGGPTRTERICISISAQLNKNPAEFSVIEQSVTGMFERRRRIGL